MAEKEEIKDKEEKKSLKQILFENRLKIVLEIRNTEIRHIQTLENIINKYMRTLLAKEITGITKEDIKNIFSNVEQLLPIHKLLLKMIDERLGDWHENQLIGDIFLKLAPFFRVYSRYQSNYDRAVVILTRCRANETFQTICEEIALTVEGPTKSLEGLLIAPIGRAPRYILHLTDLDRKTPDDHPDKEYLKRASEELERVLNTIP